MQITIRKPVRYGGAAWQPGETHDVTPATASRLVAAKAAFRPGKRRAAPRSTGGGGAR